MDVFKKIYILLLLCCSLVIGGELGLITDWADFMGDSAGFSWLEIYVKLDREDFSFLYDSASFAYSGTLHFKIEISDNEKTVDSIFYLAPISIPENEPISQQFRILNVYPFHLPVRNYQITVIASDVLLEKNDTSVFTVELHDYFVDKPLMSPIMLAHNAVPSREKNSLVRIGVKMFPNPECVYDYNSLVIYYYAEIYFPDTLQKKVGFIPKIYAADTLFRSFKTDWRAIGLASWYIGGFSIAGFPDGEYIFVLEAIDSSMNAIASTMKQIIVAKRPSVSRDKLTPALAQDMKDILHYLLTPDELDIFNALDNNGKALFWERFWSDRDPEPDTPENEFWELYITRWNYVDRTFSQVNVKGWKTDPGRIYLIYGPPDNIEHHNLSVSTNSWETWTYFSENRYFIFADILGLGSMKLVHSNVDGEIQDPYWRQRLAAPHDPIFKKQYGDEY